MTTTNLTAAIRKLSIEERLQLIEEIWDSLDDEQDAPGLTEAQRLELDRRLDDAGRFPEDSMDWEDVKAWVRSGHE